MLSRVIVIGDIYMVIGDLYCVCGGDDGDEKEERRRH